MLKIFDNFYVKSVLSNTCIYVILNGLLKLEIQLQYLFIISFFIFLVNTFKKEINKLYKFLAYPVPVMLVTLPVFCFMKKMSFSELSINEAAGCLVFSIVFVGLFGKFLGRFIGTLDSLIASNNEIKEFVRVNSKKFKKV